MKLLWALLSLLSCKGDDSCPILHYNTRVEISGVIKKETFYGPPNYGEDTLNDTKELAYILYANQPVTIFPLPSIGDGISTDSLFCVAKFQLVKWRDVEFESFIGKKVIVSGPLQQNISPHYHTDVVMNAESVTLK